MITSQGSSSLFDSEAVSSANTHSAVPRLGDLCRRVLKANVAHLVDVGDVPYSMIRDILPGCRVEQLREIEELSPHIAEEDEGEYTPPIQVYAFDVDLLPPWTCKKSGNTSSNVTFR